MYEESLAVIRFFHIGVSIVWIGLLYYFNFVQGPAFAKMDPTARQHAFTTLVPRALLFFRYAALLTVLLGLTWIVVEMVRLEDDVGAKWSDWFSDAGGKSIMVGGTIGIIMFLNVWGIIWPNQKKIIAAIAETLEKGTPAPADQPQWARTAFLASRTNVALSVPMLFFMVSSSHLTKLWE
jgi:uncharacterized membrane protein